MESAAVFQRARSWGRDISQAWRSSNKIAYLLVLPFVVHFVVFFAYPALFAGYLSFHEWKVISPDKPYVGMQNYAYLLTDTTFRRSVVNTLYFLILFLPGVVLVPLSIAVMLNQRLRFQAFFRAAYFLPIVTFDVVVALVWAWIFADQGGLLNYGLSLLGLPSLRWLSSEGLAMPAIAVTTVWRWIGYFTLIFLAGLQTIPRTVYEAAMIDGATPARAFFKITLPLLNPIILLAVVVATINGLQLFTEPYLMTGGGPNFRTLSVVYFIYQQGFRYLRMGYAATAGIVLFILMLVVILVERKVTERRFEY